MKEQHVPIHTTCMSPLHMCMLLSRVPGEQPANGRRPLSISQAKC